MVGTVALVMALGGPPLIDLGLLLDTSPVPQAGSILADPHAYWWLYVTFLSTLLPTVLHFGIACFALIAMWPKGFRTWLAEGLRSGDIDRGRVASFCLSVSIGLSVALPVLGLWHLALLIFGHFPSAGVALIGFFRWFAVLTGAI